MTEQERSIALSQREAYVSGAMLKIAPRPMIQFPCPDQDCYLCYDAFTHRQKAIEEAKRRYPITVRRPRVVEYKIAGQPTTSYARIVDGKAQYRHSPDGDWFDIGEMRDTDERISKIIHNIHGKGVGAGFIGALADLLANGDTEEVSE